MDLWQGRTPWNTQYKAACISTVRIRRVTGRIQRQATSQLSAFSNQTPPPNSPIQPCVHQWVSPSMTSPPSWSNYFSAVSLPETQPSTHELFPGTLQIQTTEPRVTSDTFKLVTGIRSVGVLEPPKLCRPFVGQGDSHAPDI